MDVNSQASGQTDQVSDDDQGNQVKDTVKYETYKKTLGQYKKTQAERDELLSQLEQYKNAEKEREEAKLKEQGEYKKLLDLARQESNELKQKVSNYENQFVMRTKIDALKSFLPGQLKRDDYLAHARINEIVLDPETGEVEESSVKAVVDDFIKNHGDLISVPNKSPATSYAPADLTPKPISERSKEEKLSLLKDAFMKGGL